MTSSLSVSQGLTRRTWCWLAAVCLLSSFTLLRQDAAPKESEQPICVFLLRHAEKRSDQGRDPQLTELGTRRAEALARLLSRSSVTHLFATQYRRTQDTLGPLAEQCGVEVAVMDAGESKALAARLRELTPGSVAVVSGHSNTIPAIAAALGTPLPGLVEHSTYGRMFPEDEYGRLVQIVLPAEGKPWLHELVVGPAR